LAHNPEKLVFAPIAIIANSKHIEDTSAIASAILDSIQPQLLRANRMPKPIIKGGNVGILRIENAS
jgi:hypothetical protein